MYQHPHIAMCPRYESDGWFLPTGACCVYKRGTFCFYM